MQDPGVKSAVSTEQLKQAEKIKDAFEAVSQTEAGQVVFQYLCGKCLFLESTIAISPTGEINPMSMVHNEARRRLYIRDIRPLIPVNIRRKIEN